MLTKHQSDELVEELKREHEERVRKVNGLRETNWKFIPRLICGWEALPHLCSVKSPDGKITRLRPTAYRFFDYLMENEGKIVTYNEMLDAVWGIHETEITTRTPEFYINELRKKFGKDHFVNVRRVGFRFDAVIRERDTA